MELERMRTFWDRVLLREIVKDYYLITSGLEPWHIANITKYMSETEIQRTILEGLWYNKILAWRNQQIPVPIRRGREIVGLRKADPFTVGMPDILALKDGVLYGIEVKTSKGRQSPEQKDWAIRIEEAGGVYILARSWEDVRDNII